MAGRKKGNEQQQRFPAEFLTSSSVMEQFFVAAMTKRFEFTTALIHDSDCLTVTFRLVHHPKLKVETIMMIIIMTIT